MKIREDHIAIKGKQGLVELKLVTRQPGYVEFEHGPSACPKI
jgi:hypothetical protein